MEPFEISFLCHEYKRGRLSEEELNLLHRAHRPSQEEGVPFKLWVNYHVGRVNYLESTDTDMVWVQSVTRDIFEYEERDTRVVELHRALYLSGEASWMQCMIAEILYEQTPRGLRFGYCVSIPWGDISYCFELDDFTFGYDPTSTIRAAIRSGYDYRIEYSPDECAAYCYVPRFNSSHPNGKMVTRIYEQLNGCERDKQLTNALNNLTYHAAKAARELGVIHWANFAIDSKEYPSFDDWMRMVLEAYPSMVDMLVRMRHQNSMNVAV